jgi:hypothetical protein
LYKTLSSNLLSSPYVDEINEDYQCGIGCNTSTTNQTLSIHQILEKKWEDNETVRQQFIKFKKASDLVEKEVL